LKYPRGAPRTIVITYRFTYEGRLETIGSAQMIRSRYTLLDFPYEAGLSEEALEAFERDIF